MPRLTKADLGMSPDAYVPDPDFRQLKALLKAESMFNIFRTMAAAPRVLGGFSVFGLTFFRGALTPRTREAVILRIAALLGSDYEWGHHVVAARAVGLNDDAIKGLREGGLEGLDEAETAGVRYGEAVEQRRVDNAIWSSARKQFDDQQLVELTLLAGFYGLACRFVLATDVALDEGIVGLSEP